MNSVIYKDAFMGVTETPVMRDNVRYLIAEVEKLERLNDSDAYFNGIASTAEEGCNQNVIVDQMQQSDINYGNYKLRVNDNPLLTKSEEYSPTSQPITQPLAHQEVQRNPKESLQTFQEMEQQRALQDGFMGVTETQVMRDNVRNFIAEVELLERSNDADAYFNGNAIAAEEGCNQNVIADQTQQSDFNYGNYKLHVNDNPLSTKSVEYSPSSQLITQPLSHQQVQMNNKESLQTFQEMEQQRAMQDGFVGITDMPVIEDNVEELIAEIERLERFNEDFDKIESIDDLFIAQYSNIGNIFDSDPADFDIYLNGISSTAEEECNQNVIVEQIQQSDMNGGNSMRLVNDDGVNDDTLLTESVDYSPTFQPIIQSPLQPSEVMQMNPHESLHTLQEMEQQRALQAQEDAEILKILKELLSDCPDEFILANNATQFGDSGLSNSETLPRKPVVDGGVLQESDPGDQSRISTVQQSQQDVFVGVNDTPVIQDNVEYLNAEIDRLGRLNDESDQIEGVKNLLIHLNENDEELLDSWIREIDRDVDNATYNNVDVINADLANSDANSNEIGVTAEAECNQNVVVEQIQQSDMNDGDHELRVNDVHTVTESVEYSPTSTLIIQPLVQHVVQINPHESLETFQEMEQQKAMQLIEINKQLQSEDCAVDVILVNNTMPSRDSGLSNSERLLTKPVINGDMLREPDPGDQSNIPILQEFQQNTNKRKRKYATRNNTKKDDARDDNENVDEVIAKKIKKSNDKPFQCDICDERFCTKSEIAKHIQVQHVKGHEEGVKKTNSIVTSGKSLKERELNQSVEKPHVCNFCQKSFRYKRLLNRHLMIHTGDKPFKCDVCKKSFNQNVVLTRHLRIHSGEKPYTCKICNKSFRQKHSLSYHLSIHADEKPHICKVCKKAFRQHCNLSRHLKTHNVEKQQKIRVQKQ